MPLSCLGGDDPHTVTLYNKIVASFNIDFVLFVMTRNGRKEIMVTDDQKLRGNPGLPAEVHDVVLRTSALGRAATWSDQ
ncbi:MAG: hypothetical protein K0S58_2070 [Nitrospira sp.]|jgi:hypothetical protein|nr:hypothetical protein [Nitrospira sp.]